MVPGCSSTCRPFARTQATLEMFRQMKHCKLSFLSKNDVEPTIDDYLGTWILTRHPTSNGMRMTITRNAVPLEVQVGSWPREAGVRFEGGTLYFRDVELRFVRGELSQLSRNNGGQYGWVRASNMTGASGSSTGPTQVQVPGKFRQVQAARVEAGAAARALTAAGVAEVQRVLKPCDLAQRAARLQCYLSTVPAPLLRMGPALAHAIRRCPRAPLVRGSDS